MYIQATVLTVDKGMLSTIKMRRLEMGLSQSDLGDVLGITKQSYGRLENGQNTFSVTQLRAVCEKLGIDFSDLDSALPMQAKTAPVAAAEYTKVVNRLLDMQAQLDHLRAAQASPMNALETELIRKMEGRYSLQELMSFAQVEGKQQELLAGLLRFLATATPDERELLCLTVESALGGIGVDVNNNPARSRAK